MKSMQSIDFHSYYW